MKPKIKCNTIWKCKLHAHVVKMLKFPPLQCVFTLLLVFKFFKKVHPLISIHVKISTFRNPNELAQAKYQGIRVDSKLVKGPNSCSMSITNMGLESPRGTLYNNSLRNQAFTQGYNPLGDNKFMMVGAREITSFSWRIQRSRSKNAQFQLLRGLT